MVYTIETDLVKRKPTSINVDPELWREVRKMAIDKGITATEYFEEALREKLARDKMGKEKHRPHTA
jgi:hypothetical protein